MYLQDAWKQRRAPPTDLSNLTAEQKLQRRNRMARYYSKLAHERREALTASLEKEVIAQRVAREIIEHAPGIAYLTLSGDMTATILHVNEAAAYVLELEPLALLGRCVFVFNGLHFRLDGELARCDVFAHHQTRFRGMSKLTSGRPPTHIHTRTHKSSTLWDITHPSDRDTLYTSLAHLVLVKTGDCHKSVACRIHNGDGNDWLNVHATFRFGALGIGCSMRI